MKLPDFKVILKTVFEKLSVLKNNMSLMISIIITFLALLLFIPTQLLSGGLKKEIQNESISKIANNIRSIEVISEKNLGEARKQLDSVIAEANSIELQAIQTTKRELLRYDIFNSDPSDPNASVSRSIFFEFGKQYCGRIDQFIKDFNADTCLSTEEITDILDEEGIDYIFSSGSGRSGRSYSGNASVEDKIEGMMIEQVCREKAETSFVYIDPFQISGYGFWSQYQYSTWDEDVENCWYSQLGYWVIEDVFDTIIAMNEGHKSLVTAPVKRLMKVYFTDELKSSNFSIGNNDGGSSQSYDDRPQYFITGDVIPKETLTGRYCDTNYDVIHFGAKFVVNTNDLARFFKELCSAKEHKYIDKTGQTYTYKHNQITILDIMVKSVNMKNENHNFYWYGDDDVAEVELTCEYLFNKKGYEDVKPQSVKDLFEENY